MDYGSSAGKKCCTGLHVFFAGGVVIWYDDDSLFAEVLLAEVGLFFYEWPPPIRSAGDGSGRDT